MRSPITLRQAWRMRGIVALGAIIGVVGFLAGETVLASGAQADGPDSGDSPRVIRSHERASERVSPDFDRDFSDPERVWSEPQRVAPARSSAPFRNCTQARAAGAAPVYAGDPGYGEHLDGDSDGIGCEPYRRR
jgi:hypothetical protein